MLKQRICIVIALLLSTPCFAQIADSANAISPLLVGEKMPQMVLMSSEKKALDIGKIFAQKPTVLIVYRGGWCPYCNLQLADLGKNEKAIIAAGYQIVALSPDNFTDLDTTKQKDSIKYLLLSDSAGLYIQKLGIAFKTNLRTANYLKSKGKNADILPVPSVFIVDREGFIKYEYINVNYKHRLSAAALICLLNQD